MPNPGDTILGQHIGKAAGYRYMWVLCEACGEGRYVSKRGQFQVKPRLCQACYLKVQKSEANLMG